MSSHALLLLLALAPWAQAEQDFMMVIGGGFHPREIEIFHPETYEQELLASPLLAGNGRMYHITAQLNSTHVLIAGGRDPITKHRLKSAGMLNVEKRELVPIAETSEQRSGAAAAVLAGEVYICGGLEGSNDRRCATEKCEKWDGKQWRYSASLRQNRGIFAMVTLNGKMYALGGEVNAGPCDTADAYSVLNTVERYDARADQWDIVAPLINKRYAHSAAAYQGKIWACGGHFDPNYETGCETYEPEKNTWSIAQATARARAGLALLNMNGVLYAVGGSSIPLSDKWYTAPLSKHF